MLDLKKRDLKKSKNNTGKKILFFFSLSCLLLHSSCGLFQSKRSSQRTSGLSSSLASLGLVEEVTGICNFLKKGNHPYLCGESKAAIQDCEILINEFTTNLNSCEADSINDFVATQLASNSSLKSSLNAAVTNLNNFQSGSPGSDPQACDQTPAQLLVALDAIRSNEKLPAITPQGAQAQYQLSCTGSDKLIFATNSKTANITCIQGGGYKYNSQPLNLASLLCSSEDKAAEKKNCLSKKAMVGGTCTSEGKLFIKKDDTRCKSYQDLYIYENSQVTPTIFPVEVSKDSLAKSDTIVQCMAKCDPSLFSSTLTEETTAPISHKKTLKLTCQNAGEEFFDQAGNQVSGVGAASSQKTLTLSCKDGQFKKVNTDGAETAYGAALNCQKVCPSSTLLDLLAGYTISAYSKDGTVTAESPGATIKFITADQVQVSKQGGKKKVSTCQTNGDWTVAADASDTFCDRTPTVKDIFLARYKDQFKSIKALKRGANNNLGTDDFTPLTTQIQGKCAADESQSINLFSCKNNLWQKENIVTAENCPCAVNQIAHILDGTPDKILKNEVNFHAKFNTETCNDKSKSKVPSLYTGLKCVNGELKGWNGTEAKDLKAGTLSQFYCNVAATTKIAESVSIPCKASPYYKTKFNKLFCGNSCNLTASGNSSTAIELYNLFTTFQSQGVPKFGSNFSLQLSSDATLSSKEKYLDEKTDTATTRKYEASMDFIAKNQKIYAYCELAGKKYKEEVATCADPTLNLTSQDLGKVCQKMKTSLAACFSKATALPPCITKDTNSCLLNELLTEMDDDTEMGFGPSIYANSTVGTLVSGQKLSFAKQGKSVTLGCNINAKTPSDDLFLLSKNLMTDKLTYSKASDNDSKTETLKCEGQESTTKDGVTTTLSKWSGTTYLGAYCGCLVEDLFLGEGNYKPRRVELTKVSTEAAPNNRYGKRFARYYGAQYGFFINKPDGTTSKWGASEVYSAQVVWTGGGSKMITSTNTSTHFSTIISTDTGILQGTVSPGTAFGQIDCANLAEGVEGVDAKNNVRTRCEANISEKIEKFHICGGSRWYRAEKAAATVKKADKTAANKLYDFYNSNKGEHGKNWYEARTATNLFESSNLEKNPLISTSTAQQDYLEKIQLAGATSSVANPDTAVELSCSKKGSFDSTITLSVFTAKTPPPPLYTCERIRARYTHPLGGSSDVTLKVKIANLKNLRPATETSSIYLRLLAYENESPHYVQPKSGIKKLCHNPIAKASCEIKTADFESGTKDCDFKLYDSNNQLRDKMIYFATHGSEDVSAGGQGNIKPDCRYLLIALAQDAIPIGAGGEEGKVSHADKRILMKLDVQYIDLELTTASAISVGVLGGIAGLAGLAGLRAKGKRTARGQWAYLGLSAMGLMSLLAVGLDATGAPVANDFVYSLLIMGGTAGLIGGLRMLFPPKKAGGKSRWNPSTWGTGKLFNPNETKATAQNDSNSQETQVKELKPAKIIAAAEVELNKLEKTLQEKVKEVSENEKKLNLQIAAMDAEGDLNKGQSILEKLRKKTAHDALFPPAAAEGAAVPPTDGSLKDKNFITEYDAVDKILYPETNGELGLDNMKGLSDSSDAPIKKEDRVGTKIRLQLLAATSPQPVGKVAIEAKSAEIQKALKKFVIDGDEKTFKTQITTITGESGEQLLSEQLRKAKNTLKEAKIVPGNLSSLEAQAKKLKENRKGLFNFFDPPKGVAINSFEPVGKHLNLTVGGQQFTLNEKQTKKYNKQGTETDKMNFVLKLLQEQHDKVIETRNRLAAANPELDATEKKALLTGEKVTTKAALEAQRKLQSLNQAVLRGKAEDNENNLASKRAILKKARKELKAQEKGAGGFSTAELEKRKEKAQTAALQTVGAENGTPESSKNTPGSFIVKADGAEKSLYVHLGLAKKKADGVETDLDGDNGKANRTIQQEAVATTEAAQAAIKQSSGEELNTKALKPRSRLKSFTSSVRATSRASVRGSASGRGQKFLGFAASASGILSIVMGGMMAHGQESALTQEFLVEADKDPQKLAKEREEFQRRLKALQCYEQCSQLNAGQSACSHCASGL